jgi:DNA topoisomerase-1
VCRKCYIHPAVLDGYLDGSLIKHLKARANRELRESLAGMTPEEAAVMAFLSARLGEETPKARTPKRRSTRPRPSG